MYIYIYIYIHTYIHTQRERERAIGCRSPTARREESDTGVPLPLAGPTVQSINTPA